MAAEFTLALDFLDTLRQTRHGVLDLVHTPADLLAWLTAQPECAVGADLPTSLAIPVARSLLDDARRLRSDVAALVEAHARGQPYPSLARHGIDRVLHVTRWSWRLVPTPSGLDLREHAAVAMPISLLGPIALSAARLLTSVEPGRLRRCASDSCGTWFVDTSKGGRRRWCSMARCGNRAKAAIHRAKERAG
jgi:predicted RNA-binding Zn ribbon-like protein